MRKASINTCTVIFLLSFLFVSLRLESQGLLCRTISLGVWDAGHIWRLDVLWTKRGS